ncbi:MAG: uroporphyrinogen decarboxylase family protein [Treponema sp.]|nr:uroporphyrinogen decarboxylase family protein [Treponema sp.]
MSEILSIDEKKKRIEANARLEELNEVPFVIEVGPMHMGTKAFYNNPDAEIQWAEDHERKRQGIYDYGFANIKPNQGINIIAGAFGCECIPNDEADPWVKCLIREENVQDVYKLKVPDVANNPYFEQAWKHVGALQCKSKIPLRVINVPSPLVTSSLIWDYTSFIEATMAYPDEVHALMEKVTEATIAYIKEMFRRITNLYGISHEFWYVPRNMGIRISDDTAALLSPNIYREYGVKYNGMIAKEFGGIVVHSCGNVANVAAAMMEIPGIKGLDFTIPQTHDWAKIRDAAAGRTALYLRHFYWDHIDDGVTDLAAYTRKIIDFFGRKGIFIQTSAPTHDEAVTLGEKLHVILSK